MGEVHVQLLMHPTGISGPNFAGADFAYDTPATPNEAFLWPVAWNAVTTPTLSCCAQLAARVGVPIAVEAARKKRCCDHMAQGGGAVEPASIQVVDPGVSTIISHARRRLILAESVEVNVELVIGRGVGVCPACCHTARNLGAFYGVGHRGLSQFEEGRVPAAGAAHHR